MQMYDCVRRFGDAGMQTTTSASFNRVTAPTRLLTEPDRAIVVLFVPAIATH